MPHKIVCVFETELTLENLRMVLDELVMRPTGFISSLEVYPDNHSRIESKTEVKLTPVLDSVVAIGGG
jgi:hypothetical protein